MMNTMSIPQMPVSANGKVHAAPPVDVPMGTISLRGIFPEDVPLLWGWMQEYPRANFDDYGPKTLEDFHVEIHARLNRREYIFVAMHDGKPVGCIGFAPITDRLGGMRGICFSKAVHGTGIAPFAVRESLRILFTANDGRLQKIEANYFRDNSRIKKFLRNLGFVHEGTRLDHTLRSGVPTDLALVALYRKNWGKPQSREVT